MNNIMQPSSFDVRDADILVVDDTPENLRVVIGLLKEAGYRARGLPNGELALQAVAKQPPNLILLDIRMPGMDGFQVCEALQQQAASRDIPIIFLSALTDAADKQRAFEAGGVDYITKPFQAKEVLARVSTHLELARNRAALIQTRNALENQAILIEDQARQLLQSQAPTQEAVKISGGLALAASSEPGCEQSADVLVVDDEPDNLRLMTQVLQNAGYKVRGAISGEMAIQAVNKQLPDLILLDILMPGFDGYQVCAALREIPASRSIPIIFLTQLTNVDDMVRAFQVGGVDYIVKPVRDTELLARVRNHVRLRQMQQGLERMVVERATQLQESEERYRRIFDSMEEGYLLADLQGTILSVNPAMLKLLKYSVASDLTGKNVVNQIYVDPVDRERLMVAVMQQGSVTGFIAGFKQRDGAVISADCNAHLLRDADGAPYAIEGTVRDVTERERAQYVERRLNRALRLLADCNRVISHPRDEASMLQDICSLVIESEGYRMAWVGVPEIDDDKTIRVIAAAGLDDDHLAQARIDWADDVSGHGPTGTAIRTRATQVNHNFASNPLMKPWREAALKHGFQSSITLPIINGEELLGVLTIYAVETDQFQREERLLLEQLSEELSLGIATIRAEQARREAEAAILQRDEMLHSLIEYSPVAMLVEVGDDGDERIELINRQFIGLFGYSKQDIPNVRQWWSLAYPNESMRTLVRAEWVKRVSAAEAALTQIEPMETTVNCQDGSTRCVSIGLATVGNRRIYTFVDLTELNRHRHHLEQLVQSRTEDLAKARDVAEAATKAKAVFLANMSHEIRTPLNAILGFSRLMCRDEELRPEHRANLDIINRSGEHLLNLINDILEMSKIEAGRIQLESAAFDLGKMLQDVSDMMQLRAVEKGLSLEVDQSSPFPNYIVGDEARLRQVLINLVGNAIKFTNSGGVSLRMGFKQNHETQLMIEVEDTGIGIAAEDQQRIFEPFVQVGDQGDSKGTGLGLTISRQYLQTMGGSITVESTPGKGTLFRVQLPLCEAQMADVPIDPDLPHGDVIGLMPGQPQYRILIVEDQKENQMLLASLMENVGLRYKIASNGEQAVQLFQEWHPQLIWMDRRMPLMNGEEATRAIRRLPNGHEVKIVAVTASAFKEQRDEMLAAGMDDFVGKPYRFDEIYACLSRQLGVKFLYAESDSGEVATEQLDEGKLAALPQALRDELKNALVSLDSERIRQIIQQIAVLDATLGRGLQLSADNFNYPLILEALLAQRVSPNDHESR